MTISNTAYTPLGQWDLVAPSEGEGGSPTAKGEDPAQLSKAHPVEAPGLVPPSMTPATQDIPLRSGPAYARAVAASGGTPQQQTTRGSSAGGVNLGNPGIKASEKGVLSTQHHEALHSLVRAISDVHSPEVSQKYVYHLWGQLHPKTREYFLKTLAHRGYDLDSLPQAQHHKAMEEAIASLISHAHDPDVRTKHQDLVGPVSRELDQANKTSLRRLQAVSSITTPEILAHQAVLGLDGKPLTSKT